MKLFAPAIVFAVLSFSILGQQANSCFAQAKDGFPSLFNGKDLTGWKLKGGASHAGKTETKNKRFQVKDSTIVIDYKTKGNMVIETEKSFEDNVVIRFEFNASKGFNNDLYFHGLKFDIREGGVKNLKFGQWHQFEIVCKGKQVVFKCDGEIQRTQNAKSSASPLGIRAEFGPIQYRKLEYKVLD
jgi:opacity protein-like surface antigen